MWRRTARSPSDPRIPAPFLPSPRARRIHSARPLFVLCRPVLPPLPPSPLSAPGSLPAPPASALAAPRAGDGEAAIQARPFPPLRGHSGPVPRPEAAPGRADSPAPARQFPQRSLLCPLFGPFHRFSQEIGPNLYEFRHFIFENYFPPLPPVFQKTGGFFIVTRRFSPFS